MGMNCLFQHVWLGTLTLGMLLGRMLKAIPYWSHPLSALSAKNYQNLIGCILEVVAPTDDLFEPTRSHEGCLQ